MVTEQYTVTTPRYNFPTPTIDTRLPQKFVEQSLRSLEQVRSYFLQSDRQPIQHYSSYEESPTALQLRPQPIMLRPKLEETLIAAVDTSAIKIGETKAGIVGAIRGAIVMKEHRVYRYTRLGPFVFHITEDNKKEVFSSLEQSYFSTQSDNSYQYAPNLLQMPIRLACLLERLLQTMITGTATNGLILFDGSLLSGTIGTPAGRLREILRTARKHGNTVLAFSKATSLRAKGHLITEFLPESSPPYLLETEGHAFKAPNILLGDIYVARLSKIRLAFRLDIDRETPFWTRVEAVEKLVGNEVLQQGYPETLRLAHIVCTFTANEVLAMQHFLTRKHGIQIVSRPDMHRLLFGPFGKGEICA